MTKCKECGTEVSSKAKSCPSCGADPRNWWSRRNIVSKVLIIVIVTPILLGFFGAMFGGGEDSSETTTEETAKPTPTEIQSTPAPMSVEEIKNKAANVSYDDLMRNNEAYIGRIVYNRGEIIQTQEKSKGKYVLRVATKLGEMSIYLGDYYSEDVIYVNYEGSRLLEEDIIDLWGEVKGLKSYESVLGAGVTIPEINALHVELIAKAGEK